MKLEDLTSELIKLQIENEVEIEGLLKQKESEQDSWKRRSLSTQICCLYAKNTAINECIIKALKVERGE